MDYLLKEKQELEDKAIEMSDQSHQAVLCQKMNLLAQNSLQ